MSPGHVSGMKLRFLNRHTEVDRLARALQGEGGVLVVLYGRRRCGKSTLLQQVVTPQDVYFLADQRERLLQIQAFAEAVDAVLPDFSAASYASWDAVFTSLINRVPQRLNVFMDEFPYLVQSAPELPSTIQRFIDRGGRQAVNWALCGSSQRMMQGAILDKTAPLYGRAQEMLKIRPLSAGWIMEALGLGARQAVTAYSVWGGVPRYWELACPHASTEEAIGSLVLDRNGVLHDEPARLLQDEMRSSVQAQSILSLIGSGCHRLSEIAGRLGKPAGSLTRPLSNLVELGYVRKEVPWGESPRSTKRILCRIDDPFVRFYFRFVLPNRSLLEMGRTESVIETVMNEMGSHCADVWEDLVRESVPFTEIGGKEWNAAARWWGHDVDGRQVELDVVAESMDREALLFGEAKWGSPHVDAGRELAKLQAIVDKLPFIRGRKVVFALWSSHSVRPAQGIERLSPEDVLKSLK
jgi:AAA+ ATPase superfamily predicted ATPase